MLIKESPLISIIVPIYNVEKYLLKCLKSIQQQTYSNLEVILINDGSLDNSGVIAEQFSMCDKRFRYFSKENGGSSSARNTGLSLANGDFIFFLDSDDWIKKEYLENLIKVFDDETDIVIGKYTLEDEKIGKAYVPFQSEKIDETFVGIEKEKEIVERHLNAYFGKGYVIKNSLMPVWKNLYRHCLITNNKITFVNEREAFPEDYIFNFEAYYYARKIRFSNDAGYVHVIVGGSLSRKFSENGLERELKRCEVIKASIEKKNFYNKDNVLKALENERLRIVIGRMYLIITGEVPNRFQTLRGFLKDKEIIHILNNAKSPNLGKKYMLILYLYRIFGMSVTYFTLRMFNVINSKYGIYRRMEYIWRK